MLWSGRVFWWMWRNTKSCLKVGVKLPLTESFQNVLLTQVPPLSKLALKVKQTTKCAWQVTSVLRSSRSRKWQVMGESLLPLHSRAQPDLRRDGLGSDFLFVLLYDRIITCVWFEHLRIKHLLKNFFLAQHTSKQKPVTIFGAWLENTNQQSASKLQEKLAALNILNNDTVLYC